MDFIFHGTTQLDPLPGFGGDRSDYSAGNGGERPAREPEFRGWTCLCRGERRDCRECPWDNNPAMCDGGDLPHGD